MILMSYYVNTLTETFAKLYGPVTASPPALPDLVFGSAGNAQCEVSAKIAQQMPQGAVWHHEIFAALEGNCNSESSTCVSHKRFNF